MASPRGAGRRSRRRTNRACPPLAQAGVRHAPLRGLLRGGRRSRRALGPLVNRLGNVPSAPAAGQHSAWLPEFGAARGVRAHLSGRERTLFETAPKVYTASRSIGMKTVEYIARALALLWAGFWAFFFIAESLASSTPLDRMGIGAAVGLAFVILALAAWRWEAAGAVVLMGVVCSLRWRMGFGGRGSCPPRHARPLSSHSAFRRWPLGLYSYCTTTASRTQSGISG